MKSSIKTQRIMKATDWLKSKGKELVCSNCGRKSTAAEEGDKCNMLQPNRENCKGEF